MSSRRNHRTRSPGSLSLEALERRDLKAGNVTVSLDAFGTMTVRGDAASNGVAIAQQSATSYRVTGLTVAGAPTRINGASWVIVNNVWKDVVVTMGDGNDYLAFNGTTSGGRATLLNDLAIVMGNGHDRVDLGAVSNRDGDDGMDVDTGTGDDIVNVQGVICRDQLTVYTGAGNDRLTVANSTLGRMYADLGADRDTAEITSNQFVFEPIVNADTGFDTGVFRNNSRSVRIRNFESWS